MVIDWKGRLQDLLLPAAEHDEGFRKEIQRQSRIGLQVIGAIQVAVSLFMLLARYIVDPNGSTLVLRLKQGALIIALGVAGIVLGGIKEVEPWARTIAAISGLATAAILMWASLMAMQQMPSPDDFIPGQITLIMLVGITTIPLLPLHSFCFGCAVGAMYLASTAAAHQYLYTGLGPDNNYVLFIAMLTLLSTAITAMAYQQRRASYDLRQTEARMLLAENAASTARLAAALSHELNTPIGALLSGVDTLLLLAARQATCPPSEQQRLVMLQSDIRRSIQQSVARLQQLVSRMQRFTNLDQAEVQDANVNDMLGDVAALVKAQVPEGVRIDLDLRPVPAVRCKPQQISAVFNSLVQNAVEALRGDGRIVISTRVLDDMVETQVSDNGRGMDPRDLENIFDPGFKVTGRRVRSGNWSMFSTRQILREHGGDIRIASQLGLGTTVIVTLPPTSEVTEAAA